MTDKEEKLELYKVMITTVIANEQRRQQAITIYLSLISVAIASLGAIKGIDPIFIIVPAMVISLVWLRTIVYFRKLAQAKFKLIHEIEMDFSIQIFKKEWDYFKRKQSIFDTGLTYIEMFIPLAITILSLSYITFRTIKYLFF